ncbi:hypothetical protein C4577_07875 [Candidatus Parcubacteria bacterium]|nr:MAG: hypothetical protein C4577_07875 [Candidatus Parcubacteria bacterium]
MPITGQQWDSCLKFENVATINCIPIVVQNVVNFMMLFSGFVAVFLIIYAGVTFVISGGDKEKIESAKKTLTYSILGLLFIIFSYLILIFISDITGVGQIVGR